MTMRKVPFGGAWMPYPLTFINAAATINMGSLQLNDSDGYTKIAYTVTCPVSGELDTFEVYIDTGAANPATTIKLSFQDLDSNGFADGVIDQYRVVTVGDILSTWYVPEIFTDDGTDTGVRRTVTRGDKLAVVAEFESANANDVIDFGVILTEEDSLRRMPAGHATNNGSWFRASQSSIAVAALRYEGPRYYPMPECFPVTGLPQVTINTGTTPDEVGLEFSMHTDVMMGGAAFCLSGAVNNAGWDCVLYDPSGAAIETVAMKLYTSLFPANGYTYWTAKFSQDRRITANEPWLLTAKPSSASSIKILTASFSDSVVLDDLYWNGSVTQENTILNNIAHFVKCSRTNGGNWDAPSDEIPMISLHVTGIEQVTGGATDDWTGDA